MAITTLIVLSSLLVLSAGAGLILAGSTDPRWVRRAVLRSGRRIRELVLAPRRWAERKEARREFYSALSWRERREISRSLSQVAKEEERQMERAVEETLTALSLRQPRLEGLRSQRGESTMYSRLLFSDGTVVRITQASMAGLAALAAVVGSGHVIFIGSSRHKEGHVLSFYGPAGPVLVGARQVRVEQ